MALFSRKDKNAELAKAVAEEIAKSLGGTPLSSAGYSVSSAASPYSGVAGDTLINSSNANGVAVPMVRPGADFGSMLGPSAPLLPMPIDPVLDESGRAMPRKYEYQVAINLNLTQTEVPFAILKGLTEQCDIVHRAIEIRVADIIKQDWSFTLSDDAITSIMEEQNVSHAKASKIGRDLYSDEIVRLNNFWENPYVASDRSYTEWLTEALWQVFAYDQLCVYPRYNLGKGLMGLDVIDAPTIKILLDNRGDIPHPPAPAYQQVLWGFPRGEFTASPDADGSFYNGAGRNEEFLTDQLAVYIKNRRTWSPYGFSPVEEAIPAATLYLERQSWMRSEYQDGTMPMTWMRTNSQELDHLKLAAFERVLNDKLAGSNAERHRVKVLPEGFDPVTSPTIDERYRSDYDEFLIKRIASIFGVTPSSLGIAAKTGLGGGKGAHDGEQDSSESVSTRPMEKYVVDVINSLSRRFLGADKNVTFVLNDVESASTEESKANAAKTALFSGFKTLNDVRSEMGEPLLDFVEADQPFIVAGSTIQFLKGSLQTDTTGEVIGQNEANPQENQNQVSQEDAQETDTQENSGQSKEDQTGLEAKSVMADEMRDFAQFVKSRNKRGNWRAFDFTTVEESVAEKLNEQAYFMVKGARPIPEKFAVWALEFAEGQSSDNLKALGLTTKRKISDLPNFKKRIAVEKKHHKAILSGLVAMISGTDGVIKQVFAQKHTSAEHLKSIVNIAMTQNIKTDTTPLGDAITALHKDAGEIVSKTQTGGNFQELLNKRNITLQGISDTTIQRINNAIQGGIANGNTAKEIGDSLSAIINDPTRADVIAITETNRAYNASFVDQLQQAGYDQFEWLAYEGACDNCLEQEGLHDISDDYPPEHPNCRCVAVMPQDSTNSANADQPQE